MSEDMTDKVRVTIDVDVDSVDLSDEVAQRVVDLSITSDSSGQESDGARFSQSMSKIPSSDISQGSLLARIHGENLEAYNLLPAVAIVSVDPEIFAEAISGIVQEGGFYAKNLDIKPDYSGYDCWLSDDGSCGFAISPERELTNVFSLQNGRGQAMMRFATSLYDRLTLNCFDGYLRKFYEYHGFQEDHREENYDGEGRDVVYMSFEFEQ